MGRPRSIAARNRARCDDHPDEKFPDGDELFESWVFRQDRWRWLYTGITRAAEKLTVVRM